LPLPGYATLGSQRERRFDEMGIIAWVLLGLVAGALVMAIHPGERPAGGVLGDLALGIAGGVLGGVIGAAVGVGPIGSFFSLGMWLMAFAGAVLMLGVFHALLGTSRRRPQSA
jgi:uncharacterized membrane protein YeaQ/YmgE (transglycosylase-associated protein family)